MSPHIEKLTEKLRAKADALQPKIDHLAAPRLVNTRKRREEDEHRQRELKILRTTQAVMRYLANQGQDMPAFWQSYPAATTGYQDMINRLLHAQWRYEKYGHQTVEDYAQTIPDKMMATLLRTMPDSPLEESRDEKIARMEREIVIGSIPGFFPTPLPVIERMIDLAQIENGMSILEPEAGRGDIVDVLADRFPLNRIDVVEAAPRLRELLVAKRRYTNLVSDDIFACGRMPYDMRYDRILMNPPFENGQDIEHVRHCFDNLLKHGGRLTAVMSPGWTFRKDRKYAEFREWVVNDQGGQVEQIEAGAFKASGTGVSSLILVLDKKPAAVSASATPDRVDTQDIRSAAFTLASETLAYLAQQEVSKVTTEDLRAALEEVAGQAEGKYTPEDIEDAYQRLLRTWLAVGETSGQAS